MEQYPICFNYILSKISENDSASLASFTLSFLQFLSMSGVSSYQEIDSELDMVTLMAQHNLIQRKGFISTKKISGKTYTIETKEDYSDFVSALLEHCNEPSSFLTLLQKSGFTDNLCKLCSWSSYYSSAYLSKELQLANFMLRSQDSFDCVMDSCGYALSKIFKSDFDLYEILPVGSISVAFPGLRSLIESVSAEPFKYFDMRQPVISSFEHILLGSGITENLLNTGGKRKENILAIYDYISEMIKEIVLPEDYSYEEEIKFLLNRPSYIPPFDADGVPVSYKMLQDFNFVEKDNSSLNCIREEKSSPKAIKRHGKKIEPVNFASYESEVFSEFNEEYIVADSDTTDDSSDVDIEPEVISAECTEIVNDDGNLVDPTMLSDTNEASDLDDDLDDDYCQDSSFGWSTSFSKDNEDAGDECTRSDVELASRSFHDEFLQLSSTETITSESKNENQTPHRLPGNLDTSSQFLLDPIKDIPLIAEIKEELHRPEHDRIISISRNNTVYIEPVIFDSRIYLYFCLFDKKKVCIEYLCDLSTAEKMFHYHDITLVSYKPYLSYKEFSRMRSLENSFQLDFKLQGIYPIAELDSFFNRRSYYSSVSCDIHERAVTGLSVVDNLACNYSMSNNFKNIVSYSSALGYFLERKRFVQVLSKADTCKLFTVASDGTILPNNIGDILIPFPSVKDETHFFKIYFYEEGNANSSAYAEIIRELFIFLEQRGDVRNLPFSVLYFSNNTGEILFVSLSYCYEYIRSLVIMFIDNAAHKKGFENLWIDVEIVH